MKLSVFSAWKLSVLWQEHGQVLLRNPANVGFSANTRYVLFPLFVCSQCSFCVGNSMALVWLGRVGLRVSESTASRTQEHPQAHFQDLPVCLWTPWHSSPWEGHYPLWEQHGHSAAFRAPQLKPSWSEGNWGVTLFKQSNFSWKETCADFLTALINFQYSIFGLLCGLGTTLLICSLYNFFRGVHSLHTTLLKMGPGSPP